MKQLLLKYNLTNDNALIILSSLAGMLMLAPLSVYRFITGNYGVAGVDFLIVCLLFVMVVLSWKRKATQSLKIVLMVLYMGGVYTALFLKGADLFPWAYPVLIASYFFLSSRLALLINTLFLLGSIPISYFHLSIAEFISYYPSMVLVIFLVYIFSRITEDQKNELLKLATEDALTRVGNRRVFNEKVKEIVGIHSRIPQKSSMLLFDLDHFKKVNDIYGHPVGDKILRELAAVIKSNIRITDYFYRYGGEEFVIIANNTSLKNAGHLANYIRDIVEKDPFLLKYKVTISMGVAELSKYDNVESWLQRTDVALYEAKSGGRNIVYLAKPSEDWRKKAYTFEPFRYFAGTSSNYLKKMESVFKS